jgi:hypothetical protein
VLAPVLEIFLGGKADLRLRGGRGGEGRGGDGRGGEGREGRGEVSGMGE